MVYYYVFINVLEYHILVVVVDFLQTFLIFLNGNFSCVSAFLASEVEIGVVVKIDSAEAEAPSVQVALQLTGCSVAAVILSMALLALLTAPQLLWLTL